MDEIGICFCFLEVYNFVMFVLSFKLGDEVVINDFDFFVGVMLWL